MGIRECYADLGGNYDDVLRRLMNERIVEKFTLKFLSDNTFDLLKESIESGNDEETFRAAHTLKGISQNLGFSRLYESSNALTDSLRGGRHGDLDELYAKVAQDYEITVNAIRKHLT